MKRAGIVKSRIRYLISIKYFSSSVAHYKHNYIMGPGKKVGAVVLEIMRWKRPFNGRNGKRARDENADVEMEKRERMFLVRRIVGFGCKESCERVGWWIEGLDVCREWYGHRHQGALENAVNYFVDASKTVAMQLDRLRTLIFPICK